MRLTRTVRPVTGGTSHHSKPTADPVLRQSDARSPWSALVLARPRAHGLDIAAAMTSDLARDRNRSPRAWYSKPADAGSHANRINASARGSIPWCECASGCKRHSESMTSVTALAEFGGVRVVNPAVTVTAVWRQSIEQKSQTVFQTRCTCAEPVEQFASYLVAVKSQKAR